VCCVALQCVAVCLSVLQCVAVRSEGTLQAVTAHKHAIQLPVTVLLQCVAVRCNVLQYVAVCSSVSQCAVPLLVL